ncbi:HD domain-containing phosphohydrolase [Arthrobacter sp. STN4]|uniref:HD domain-containing phosphohydrolase n=1 Tax=Arthrobacter sp. STN4 TaxID=2923276 RepID=UPI00211A613F|nr:HD domain-containing phosphohydrolase [Arthrobacter sp. STN4]MCQ9163149.1 LuxR C-terminal-related transcriptional regulator [Arthrobacter sp. STN4]
MAAQDFGDSLRLPTAPGPAGMVPRAPFTARRAEVLAALSLAIDLGLGQPMDHMLRAMQLGARMADLLDIGPEARARTYYANLLAWIGCHADSFELAARFGDDIGFRADYYLIDARGLPMLTLMLHRTGTELPPLRRAARQSRFAATAGTAVRKLIRSHCLSAGQLANRVGLDPGMPEILGHAFERWDGKGLPAGRAGVEIPLEMRIAQLADTAEVFLRTGGLPAAVAMVRQRRGTQFDPELADLFCARAAALAAGLLEGDPWPAALAAAPGDDDLTEAGLDAVLAAMGDFADLKCPWTAGHSRAVASLAAAAGREWALPATEVELLRRAGWAHDLGRMGVSNAIWDKQAQLSSMDRERLQMYPFLSERILGRVPGLRRVAGLAGAHRERLDGSGYPRGLSGAGLDAGQRILAAADAYQGSLEPRPHRRAATPAEAAARLRSDVVAGRLDARAVDAVLRASGGHVARRRSPAAGLTPRELEVLALLCRGMNNKDIAAALFIAPKTARNHVEHIYEKTGAANRVSATLFALDHGLWERVPGTNPGIS